MKSTTASDVIAKLKAVFVTFGLPDETVRTMVHCLDHLSLIHFVNRTVLNYLTVLLIIHNLMVKLKWLFDLTVTSTTDNVVIWFIAP